MDVTLSTWFVILLALAGANLPFLNERLFAVVPRAGFKPFWLRLLELALFYGVVALAAWLLESRAGNAFTQGWEFFSVTILLFIVFAYPGYVFRYLRKQRPVAANPSTDRSVPREGHQ